MCWLRHQQSATQVLNSPLRTAEPMLVHHEKWPPATKQSGLGPGAIAAVSAACLLHTRSALVNTRRAEEPFESLRQPLLCAGNVRSILHMRTARTGSACRELGVYSTKVPVPLSALACCQASSPAKERARPPAPAPSTSPRPLRRNVSCSRLEHACPGTTGVTPAGQVGGWCQEKKSVYADRDTHSSASRVLSADRQAHAVNIHCMRMAGIQMQRALTST
jgi:hypothetical protein